MNKTFSYIVTKNYFNPASSDNAFSNIIGVFHDKQDAIYFVDKLVEEYRREPGIILKHSPDNNSDDNANCVYSVDFRSWGKGEDFKTIYRVDSYEIIYNLRDRS